MAHFGAKNSDASSEGKRICLKEKNPFEHFSLHSNNLLEFHNNPEFRSFVTKISSVGNSFHSSLASCAQFLENLAPKNNNPGLRCRTPPLHLCMASINNADDVISHSVSDSHESRRRNVKGEDEDGKKKIKVVKTEKKPQAKNLFKAVIDGMICGATAGVTVETVLYPIDTIKTRLQVARQGGGINFKGLYSGLSGNLVGVLPASAIFIGVYEPVKQKLLSLLPENASAFAHLTAGALGGLAASLVRVPTEVIKQRMQLREFASPAAAIGTIVSKEGFKGLFAGYSSFLLRDLPFDAIQFMLYEQFKIAGKSFLKRDLHDSEMAVIGAVSGAATGAITTPLDVIKTRLMTQGASGQFTGIGDCIAKTLAEEGASAFLKGIGPRVLWIGIGGSIFFGVLEKTKQVVDKFENKLAVSGATS